jgi:hypothetical protein
MAMPTCCPYCKSPTLKETNSEGGFYRFVYTCGSAYNIYKGKEKMIQSRACKTHVVFQSKT